MAIIFDGKTYSLKKKELLRISVNRLREKGIIPHLATIIAGSDPASILYTNLKKKFIEEIGCQLDIYKLSSKVDFSEIKLLINTLNDDETVHGIMLQLPLPDQLKINKEEIINLIKPEKDIDGLQENKQSLPLRGSKFLHPTSKAVLEILALAIYKTKINVKSVCVIGADGMVGKPLVKQLLMNGYKVTLQGETLQSDAVVSATGVINLIGPEMVKENQIIIDVGSPFGDVSPEACEKVAFVTPVPGGVGPVTITCLTENLILSAQSTISW